MIRLTLTIHAQKTYHRWREQGIDNEAEELYARRYMQGDDKNQRLIPMTPTAEQIAANPEDPLENNELSLSPFKTDFVRIYTVDIPARKEHLTDDEWADFVEAVVQNLPISSYKRIRIAYNPAEDVKMEVLPDDYPKDVDCHVATQDGEGVSNQPVSDAQKKRLRLAIYDFLGGLQKQEAEHLFVSQKLKKIFGKPWKDAVKTLDKSLNFLKKRGKKTGETVKKVIDSISMFHVKLRENLVKKINIRTYKIFEQKIIKQDIVNEAKLAQVNKSIKETPVPSIGKIIKQQAVQRQAKLAETLPKPVSIVPPSPHGEKRITNFSAALRGAVWESVNSAKSITDVMEEQGWVRDGDNNFKNLEGEIVPPPVNIQSLENEIETIRSTIKGNNDLARENVRKLVAGYHHDPKKVDFFHHSDPEMMLGAALLSPYLLVAMIAIQTLTNMYLNRDHPKNEDELQRKIGEIYGDARRKKEEIIRNKQAEIKEYISPTRDPKTMQRREKLGAIIGEIDRLERVLEDKKPKTEEAKIAIEKSVKERQSLEEQVLAKSLEVARQELEERKKAREEYSQKQERLKLLEAKEKSLLAQLDELKKEKDDVVTFLLIDRFAIEQKIDERNEAKREAKPKGKEKNQRRGYGIWDDR